MDWVVGNVISFDFIDDMVLWEVGIFEIEMVIVVIGNYFKESIIICFNFKEGGVKLVVVKVFFDIYEKIFKCLGVDLIIFFEYKVG